MAKKEQTLTENPTWSFSGQNQKNKFSGKTKDKRRAYQHYQKATSTANLKFLKDTAKGFTINFCCGQDPNGNVKVDIDKKMLRRQKKSTLDKADYIIADVHYYPFIEKCCDTLIIDPPFSLYNRFKWILNIKELTKERVIISHPVTNLKLRGFTRELYFINSKSIFLRLWWVFTRTAPAAAPTTQN